MTERDSESIESNNSSSGTPPSSGSAPARPRRGLAVIGGVLQIFFVLLLAMYNGFYYEGSEYKARVILFSLPHVILFLFCVFSKKFWLTFATIIACIVTLIVDGGFLWYFWGAPQPQADLWQLSLWLILKLLPALSLIFLSLWMRSLDRLKKKTGVDHVTVH